MHMLRSIKDMQGYELGAQDGKIGRCRDFLFDDRYWAIRYIVADTQKWLPGRKVLISPISIGDANGLVRILSVSLTKDQIKNAPRLEADAPVSRQYEIVFNRYYDWSHYWEGSDVWGKHTYPRLLHRTFAEQQTPELVNVDSRLRSTREVQGYRIRTKDDGIGHVEDFIVDQNSWIIRYLVLDTSNWLPGSKRVLITPAWVEYVQWKEGKVQVNLSSEQIRNSPPFDPMLPVSRRYETALFDFFGKPHYWKT